MILANLSPASTLVRFKVVRGLHGLGTQKIALGGLILVVRGQYLSYPCFCAFDLDLLLDVLLNVLEGGPILRLLLQHVLQYMNHLGRVPIYNLL